MPRVIIIDDDEELLPLMEEMLAGANYEATAFNRAEAGLAAIGEAPPDIVIVDILMPDKEGLETIREIRTRYPQTRVLAISGGGRVSGAYYLDVARRLGATATLAKPFTRQVLLDQLSELDPEPSRS